MKPFEPNKTAEELGIDKTRKFVVVEREKGSSVGIFEDGEIIHFTGHGCTALFKNDHGNEEEMRWSELAYAEENAICGFLLSVSEYGKQERCGNGSDCPIHVQKPYVPRVGDRVSAEGEIVGMMYASGEGREYESFVVRFDESEPGYKRQHCRFYKQGSLKLLSRKPPRKVTMEEVREKFGEDVEIVGE